MLISQVTEAQTTLTMWNAECFSNFIQLFSENTYTLVSISYIELHIIHFYIIPSIPYLHYIQANVLEMQSIFACNSFFSSHNVWKQTQIFMDSKFLLRRKYWSKFSILWCFLLFSGCQISVGKGEKSTIDHL